MPETTQRLLAKIENKELVLPEFQREFTWNKKQSLELIDSILKGYPTGSLLLWKTASVPALKNMPDFRPDGRVEVLLDGQQRLTTLYMLIKDAIPPYYSERDVEESKDPRQLYFNVETRDLGYYQQIEMGNNPRWVRVCDCFKGEVNLEQAAKLIAADQALAFGVYAQINKNYTDLRSILDVTQPVMYVRDDADLKHALTVFDRVNSNGTPLGEADLALAHMCSAWAETRRVFKEKLAELKTSGFDFDLRFMIRGMNAVVNGRAEYKVLHDNTSQQLIAGWNALTKLLDYLVNLLRDRAFIYGTDDLSTSNVLIPILGYLSQNGLKFTSDSELKRLIYWMYAALYQGRYSASVDQKLEAELNAVSGEKPIDSLMAILREDKGDPTISPDNLDSRGVGHPLYNMMHIVVRAAGGVDWSNGLGLERPFGRAFSVERHHIFPAAVLADAGYDTGKNLTHKKRVNEIANRVPLTRSGNMDVFDRPPSDYLPIVQSANPGNLEKFMVPVNPSLWHVENYEAFLLERRTMVATSINRFMTSLLQETPQDVRVTSDRPKTQDLITGGESDRVEFKSTLRWNLRAERNGKEIEHEVLKTIAGFFNTEGGTLLIGVADQGEVVGLAADNFENDDKFLQHLTNLIKGCIGPQYVRFLKMGIDTVNSLKICRVECQPSVVPVYLSTERGESFYIRTGVTTTDLPTSAIYEYIQSRF